MADMSILIRNPDVVRDIQTLAERTGKPPVDAVADAVRAQLGIGGAAPAKSTAEKEAELREILARIDALPHRGQRLTDQDLYDEDGLPR